MRCFQLVVLLLAACLLAGCTATGMMVTGAKTAARVVIGAEAKVVPLQDLPDGTTYGSVRLGEVTTDIAPIVPAEKLAIIRTEMELKLDEESKKAFAASGKALVANIAARFLKERGTFGGDARLDLIATLIDAESRQEVARLFVEGVSDSPTAGKAEHLARENARELVRHVAKRQKGEKKE